MRAAKAAERDRIMAMSVRERIELAFALGRKYSALSRLTTRAEP